jgi:hypothetical protein
LTGTYENSCRLEGNDLLLFSNLIIVNIHEMSDKWSNGICAFLNVYRRYGMLWDVESVKYDNRHARNEGMK